MWIKFCREFCRSESGVTSIEYALIGLLIAVVIVATVTFVGVELEETYNHIADCITGWSCG